MVSHVYSVAPALPAYRPIPSTTARIGLRDGYLQNAQ